jgi:hypothetical protein
MLLRIKPGEDQWSFTIEGKLHNGMAESELLQDKSGNFRFMAFFESL